MAVNDRYPELIEALSDELGSEDLAIRSLKTIIDFAREKKIYFGLVEATSNNGPLNNQLEQKTEGATSPVDFKLAYPVAESIDLSSSVNDTRRRSTWSPDTDWDRHG